jgi:hypothetical protein
LYPSGYERQAVQWECVTAQRVSSAAAEERSDEGTGKRRLPAVGCNAGLGKECSPNIDTGYEKQG